MGIIIYTSWQRHLNSLRLMLLVFPSCCVLLEWFCEHPSYPFFVIKSLLLLPSSSSSVSLSLYRSLLRYLSREVTLSDKDAVRSRFRKEFAKKRFEEAGIGDGKENRFRRKRPLFVVLTCPNQSS